MFLVHTLSLLYVAFVRSDDFAGQPCIRLTLSWQSEKRHKEADKVHTTPLFPFYFWVLSMYDIYAPARAMQSLLILILACGVV
jgi:hypothetical protein